MRTLARPPLSHLGLLSDRQRGAERVGGHGGGHSTKKILHAFTSWHPDSIIPRPQQSMRCRTPVARIGLQAIVAAHQNAQSPRTIFRNAGQEREDIRTPSSRMKETLGPGCANSC